MQSTNFKFIRFLFFISIYQILIGCSTTASISSSSTQVDKYSEFATGASVLTCGVGCSASYGYNRSNLKTQYSQGAWASLAREVLRIGFHSDHSYYYLGRAAEELGYVDAAKNYYYLSLSDPQKCYGTFDNCDGLDVRYLVNLRLKSLTTIDNFSQNTRNGNTSNSFYQPSNSIVNPSTQQTNRSPDNDQCMDISSSKMSNFLSLYLKGKRYAVFDKNSGQVKPRGPYYFNSIESRNSLNYSSFYNPVINGEIHDLNNLYIETSTSYFESLSRKIGCDPIKKNTVTAVRLIY